MQNMIIELENITARAVITKIDQTCILEKIKDAEYRPNNFPAIVVDVGKNVFVSVFDSGKITSKGAKSQQSAIQSITDFIKKINRMGIKCTIKTGPTVSLIVAKVVFDKNIDVKRLKKTANYKKDIACFGASQFEFSGANARVYLTRAVISGNDLSNIINAAKQIYRYANYEPNTRVS